MDGGIAADAASMTKIPPPPAALGAGFGLGDEPAQSIPRPVDPEIRRRSDLVQLFALNARVDEAAMLVTMALAAADAAGVRPPALPVGGAVVSPGGGWHDRFVDSSLARLRDVRNAVCHRWDPPAPVDEYVRRAFAVLAAMTPAQTLLVQLFAIDRGRAVELLDTYMGMLDGQIRLTARLASDLDKGVGKGVVQACAHGLDALLAKAGELLTLTQAADRLDVSRQALHQRVQRGTVLALRRGGELLLPAFQFAEQGGRQGALMGLADVLAPFRQRRGGEVAALRFLLRVDAELGTTPLSALRAGAIGEVASAARRAAARTGDVLLQD